MNDTLAPPVETSEVHAQRVLVLAPHADDDVIGCGGLLAQLAGSGAEVKVLFLTDSSGGEEIKTDQEAYAARRLEGRRPARQFSRWVTGCLVSAPRDRYRTLFGALRWGRAVRDCIQVTTRTRTPAAAGNIHRAGALIAGAYV